ncbi:hypothetical protein EPUS_05453 [Endocarpon pusillum Z07020]|uniref:Uncharacterized protein n=1 Tax=Endocarpon pusillum (strain Z07020 / HMAS-L-300199) TaxID=1263415 RepID=U1HLM3_ENDPU|nr:uncharacterized protein EPUS_05453 [Endocarpon pusillum Z07020]ERF69909.1 hypothetical protein EPUS_05453 [Endocarpon pusillum Z07020]
MLGHLLLACSLASQSSTAILVAVQAPLSLIYPPWVANGNTNSVNAVATAVQSDALSAYNAAAALLATQHLTGQDLGGLTPGPGVYKFSSSAQFSGTHTLNAGGIPNAQFIFQVGSTIATSSESTVNLIHSAQACSVFFLVGNLATLGAGIMFKCVSLASTAINVTISASNVGWLIALNHAVTLGTNTSTGCSTTLLSSSSASASTTGMPTTSSTGMMNAVTSSNAVVSSSTVSASPFTEPASQNLTGITTVRYCHESNIYQ